MRKIFVLVMILAVSPACALELPENVGQWHSVSRYILPLITEYNGESHGRVTYRTYKRDVPSGFLEVILTEGGGAGSLYIPPEVNASEGMMPADSGFEAVKVSGHDAIIESRSFMPLVLSVSLSRDITLTVEACFLNKEGIIDFSESMIQSLEIP